MLIGIDGNEANVTKRLGVGEIAYNLIKNLSTLQKSNITVYLKDSPVYDLKHLNNNLNFRILKPGKLWTQWRLPLDLYLHQPRPDVFFTPTHYAPRFSPVPTVISIMDLAYLYFPELFKKRDIYKLKNWTGYSAKNAKKVITISKSTKFDIIKEYKIDEHKIAVIYPGIKPVQDLKISSNEMNNILKTKYDIIGPFILFVGTIQPRKNIGRLIEAFSRVILNRKIPAGLQLIIIGKKGWLYDEILKKPKELSIEEKVKFLDFVPDEDLAVFYKKAICYVLPSLYEGFGLPVLEAMKYGCPVITSKISSLPEAGGEAAIYVDPENIGDIAEKITTVITDAHLRNEMREKGKKQLAKFSWEKSAKETLKILEEVGKKH